MKASRFTAEPIVVILHEAAAGGPVRELCRRHGITETTLYRWRRQ
jgi:putative transposase